MMMFVANTLMVMPVRRSDGGESDDSRSDGDATVMASAAMA
jgi:hypothetical protein